MIELKIKVVTVMDEARRIRREEDLAYAKGDYETGNKLHLHRVGKLRRAARNMHLAYAFARGKQYRQVESLPKNSDDPGKPITLQDRKEIARMLTQYHLEINQEGVKEWIETEDRSAIAA